MPRIIAHQLAGISLSVVFGRLGDIHGRYAIYGTGFAIMAASAFFCGMAPSVVWEHKRHKAPFSAVAYERRPVEAIQGLDRRGRVIYVGTLSKALFPALRLGYVVVPRSLIDPFRAAKWVAGRQTSTFFQEVVAGVIRDGDLERHVRRARTLLAGRRRSLLEAITAHLADAVEISGSDAGLHLVLWIRGMRIGRALETLISRAARAGGGVYSVAPLYVTPPRRAGLFLGYAGLDESDIGAGIERLAGVLRGIRADG